MCDGDCKRLIVAVLRKELTKLDDRDYWPGKVV